MKSLGMPVQNIGEKVKKIFISIFLSVTLFTAISVYAQTTLETPFKECISLLEKAANEQISDVKDINFGTCKNQLEKSSKENLEDVYADDAEYFLFVVETNDAERIKIAEDLIQRYPQFSLEPWTIERQGLILPNKKFDGIDQIKVELMLIYLKIKDYQKTCDLLNELLGSHPEEKNLAMMLESSKTQGRCQ